MKKLAVVAVVFPLILGGTCPAAETDDTIHSQLRKLDCFVGNWRCEARMKQPGEPEKKFSVRSEIEWVLGGQFLRARELDATADGCGQQLHCAMIGWSEKEQAVVGWGFWAPGIDLYEKAKSGRHERLVYEETEDGWLITREGFRGEITVESEDKYTYEAEWESKDGRKHQWSYTARRIKPPTRREVKKWLKYLEGTWVSKWSGSMKLPDSTYHRRPIKGGMALLTEFSEGKIIQTEIVGWQPNLNILLATGYGSDGQAHEIRFNEFGDDCLRGPIAGRLPDGTEYKGLITLKRTDAAHHTFTMQILVEAKPVELTAEVRKRE
ncbi:MAG: hypothetical protein R6U98_30445 [Pirellulaceae bacterium]